MEVGKIYIIKDSYRPGSSIYKLIRFDKDSWACRFWFKNKFGEGETTKDYWEYKNRFIEAPKIYQVLYGN